MHSFSFLLAAPTLKVTDKESYRFAMQQWRETVEWCVSNFPGIVNTAPPVPPTPSFIDKGPWERLYLDRHPNKRSVRFTTRFREMPRRNENGEIMLDENGDFIPLYPDKEAFCQALCEGVAEGEPDSVDRPLVPPMDPEGLH